MNTNEFLKEIIALIDGWKLMSLVILLAVDFVAGILVALKCGTFSFQKLPSFLKTGFLYFVAGYILVGIVAVIEPSLKIAVIASYALLLAGFLAGIGSKLRQLGVPIPETLVK